MRPAKAGEFNRMQACQGKSQSPVARMAERREIDALKPIDRGVRTGTPARPRAVTKVNADVASKLENPRVEPFLVWAKTIGEGGVWRNTPSPLGGVSATARGQGLIKQLERPYPPRSEMAGEERLHNRIRERSRRREGVGWAIVAMKAGNAAGAKGPC